MWVTDGEFKFEIGPSHLQNLLRQGLTAGIRNSRQPNRIFGGTVLRPFGIGVARTRKMI